MEKILKKLILLFSKNIPLFIKWPLICLHYMLWTSIDLIKENGFTINKKEKKSKKQMRYPEKKSITNVDYTVDLALPANAPAQAESLLHSLEQTARGI